MSDGNDVERHYQELKKQLVEDGFSPDSEVMKTTIRLAKALKEDGFSLNMSQNSTKAQPVDVKEPLTPVTNVVRTPSVDPSAASSAASADLESEAVVRAFRTKEQFDTDIITSVFASIEGWRTKVIEHNGSHFVIATNAKRLTDNRVKKALVAYVAERKQHGVT